MRLLLTMGVVLLLCIYGLHLIPFLDCFGVRLLCFHDWLACVLATWVLVTINLLFGLLLCFSYLFCFLWVYCLVVLYCFSVLLCGLWFGIICLVFGCCSCFGFCVECVVACVCCGVLRFTVGLCLCEFCCLVLIDSFGAKFGFRGWLLLLWVTVL